MLPVFIPRRRFSSPQIINLDDDDREEGVGEKKYIEASGQQRPGRSILALGWFDRVAYNRYRELKRTRALQCIHAH
jgi:hypothetical protein